MNARHTRATRRSRRARRRSHGRISSQTTGVTQPRADAGGVAGSERRRKKWSRSQCVPLRRADRRELPSNQRPHERHLSSARSAAGLLQRGEVVETPVGQHLRISVQLDQLWQGGANLLAARQEFLRPLTTHRHRRRQTESPVANARIHRIYRGTARPHDRARPGNLRPGRLGPVPHRPASPNRPVTHASNCCSPATTPRSPPSSTLWQTSPITTCCSRSTAKHSTGRWSSSAASGIDCRFRADRQNFLPHRHPPPRPPPLAKAAAQLPAANARAARLPPHSRRRHPRPPHPRRVRRLRPHRLRARDGRRAPSQRARPRHALRSGPALGGVNSLVRCEIGAISGRIPTFRPGKTKTFRAISHLAKSTHLCLPLRV